MKTFSKVVALLLALSVVVGGCYGHDEKSVADTNTNWLDCETDDDCDDDLACVEGACDESILLPPPGPVRLDFEGDPLVLDDDRYARSPIVRFADGHWTVALLTEEWTTSDSHALTLRVHEVERTGLLGSSYAAMFEESFVTQSSQVLIGLSPTGQAVVWNEPNGWQFGETCKMTIVRWETDERRDVDVPCALIGSVAYVAASDHWLVAATDGADLLLGSHAFEGNWVQPLTVIDSLLPTVPTIPVVLSSDGKAASLLWGTLEDSRGLAIADVAEPTVRTTLERLDGARESDSRYSVAQLDDRAIAVGVRREGVWSSVVREGTTASAVHVVGSAVYEGRPSITASAQHGLLAVCYQTAGPEDSQGASVIVVDRDGRAASDPLVLSEDRWRSFGCDLAWSDDALLVAWIDATFDEEEERIDNTVSARRIVVTR